ncbi:periphilin-1 isoform X2 [Echeneis naucrates]|nr:periphilin-1-like isoform X2 [Echeneis naucrates]XP_029377987.1 periphilin-1-like isoform X2 [Echeneis naucrates]
MAWMGGDCDRGFNDEQWYDSPRIYQEKREYYNDDGCPPINRRYYEKHNFGNFSRHSSPPRMESPYSQHCYSRDDLRHQLDARNNGRPGPYFRNRGRPRRPALDRISKEDQDYRTSSPAKMRDRSPGMKEASAPVRGRSGSNTSNKSFSPDKGCTSQQAQQKQKPFVPTSDAPSSSVEESPPGSGSSKEKTPASQPELEEVVAASMEPTPTPENDFKTRRLEAIKAKALEIETHYRQDCETFRTVVKMLVAKEPSLDNLLQAPLDKNLSEIKQRCLDDLKHFVKELDEV